MKRFFIILYLAWSVSDISFALAQSTSAKPEWQMQWEKTLASAKAEGEVTIYAQHQMGTAIQAFTQAYPMIKLNFVGGYGADLIPKVLAEYRANKRLVDVSIGGTSPGLAYFKAGLLQPMSSAFILPEVKDPSRWWGNKHNFSDPEYKHVIMMVGNVTARMGAYNTQLVKPEEIQTWWDLVGPKWKNKIVAPDPKSTSSEQDWRFVYYHPELGPQFLRRLFTEIDVTLSGNFRQMMDWLGTGKYAVNLFAQDVNIDPAIKQGLPVETLFNQRGAAGISSSAGNLSLFKDAPHPHAARVYVNWILSREGQLSWQKITGYNSMRIDIPKDTVRAVYLPKEGVNYLLVNDPKYGDFKPVLALIDEAFKESKQK